MRNHPGEAIAPAAADSASFIVRPAQLSDVQPILDLINGYAAQEIMLPRNEVELCEGLRDFLVAVDGDQLLGCGALHLYTRHMAELRSLAVSSEHTRSGVGQALVRELLDQAKEFGVDVVFVFTYVPGFFEKTGFHIIDRASLPLKAWKDCLRCPKFTACDEIAMAFMVTPGAEIYMSHEPPELPYVEGPLIMPKLGQPRVLDKPKPRAPKRDK
ncbi:MAG: hypothetical protein A3F68_12600 [Acidobacteria bacterium RIFCSPLOWO2_12_FULL_54_10]|nr:MAG: hypothetical protein A3F68_12600 [Acidobacteria bacterium RIFCSPLOWO2_12_FULL_54_10]